MEIWYRNLNAGANINFSIGAGIIFSVVESALQGHVRECHARQVDA